MIIIIAMGRFEGKIVIVTGASSGIGAATAIAFAKEGAKLTIQGRNKERLKKTGKLCRDLGAEALEVVADLRELKNLEMIINRTVEKYSSIDILVNSAGIVTQAGLSEIDLEQYEDIMNTNLRAPVFLCKYSLPYLKKTQGCVINVSSVAGIAASPAVILYSMAKCALDHFTKGFAAECASFGVRVNSINPGFVDTSMVNPARMQPEKRKVIHTQVWDFAVASQPLGILPPDVVTENILFLCASSYTTGITFPVDGGYLLPN